MHRFTIDDIAETWVAMPGTTFGYYDVELPERIVPGHAIVNVTDIDDADAWREHTVTVLNKIAEEEGDVAVIEALASGDGLKIPPPPI